MSQPTAQRPAKTSHARGPLLKGVVPFLVVLGLGIPGVVIAQSADEVSRTADGHILHRRPPSQATGSSDPTPETPVFIYDPARADGLPSELQRDGRSLARPSDSLEPGEDEPVHTPDGPKPSEPPNAASTPAGPQTIDPSAPPPRAADDAAGEPTPGADASGPYGDTIGDTGPAAPGEPGGDPSGDPSGEPGADPMADPGDALPSEPSSDAENPSSAENPGEEPEQRPVDPRVNMGDEAMPDRQTQREGRLDYREVFDPSIVPHKRNRALDEVGADFGVRLGERRLRALEVLGNRLERGREVFWGSLLIEGAAGSKIPIPSVAPEARILSYEASPEQEVKFWVDQAGNHYVEPARSGRLRLVFMTDAPASYFGRSLPRNASFSDVPAALRPKLPREVRELALEVADTLGFSTDLGYAALLEKMVAYFRGFEAGDPPPRSGPVTGATIYRDIALSRRGICRHRAHAFVVTAQALGFPARFVFNEAHAFAEVYLPGANAGWLRVDLGGGADELRVHNTANKAMHEPVAPDPFERPDGFEEMAGAERVTGLPERELAPGSAGPGSEMAALPSVIPRAKEVPGTRPTQTTLRVDTQLVTRGDGLTVSGEVVGGGAAIDGGVVQVLLVEPGSGRAVALLGTAAVRGGRYESEVRIPAEQVVGDYELVVEFLGHEGFGPSVGR